MGSWGRSAPGLAQGEARVATEHWKVEMTQHNSHRGAAFVSFLAHLITPPDVLIQSSCPSPASKCDFFYVSDCGLIGWCGEGTLRIIHLPWSLSRINSVSCCFLGFSFAGTEHPFATQVIAQVWVWLHTRLVCVGLNWIRLNSWIDMDVTEGARLMKNRWGGGANLLKCWMTTVSLAMLNSSSPCQ